MKKILLAILSVLLIVIGINFSKIKLGYKYYVTPCYYDKPVKQNDFPQVFLEIDLEAYYSKINELAAPFFKIDTLETIHYKNKAYPILSLSNKKKTLSENKMLVVAGVHGNESGGTLAIIELLKELNKNPNKLDNWNLKILTPVNPVGTLEMSRYNECGCDLNRKVNSSTQKGIVVQRNIVDSFNPNVIVSMHEAPSSGFLIHSNNRLNDQLLHKLLKETEEKGIVLSTKDYLGQELPLPGNSKLDGGLKVLNKLLQVQALGNYVSEKDIVEITTESGWNSQDKFQRINSHVFLTLSLMDNYHISE